MLSTVICTSQYLLACFALKEPADVLTVRHGAEDSEYGSADCCPEDTHFSYFYAKEFLTHSRLADVAEYPIFPYSAHAALAQALLGILLNLGDQVDKITVEKDHLPFTRLGTGKSPRRIVKHSGSRIPWNVFLTKTSPTLRHGIYCGFICQIPMPRHLTDINSSWEETTS
ncbi:hypothetical protein EDB85DRAFT_441726 [Lactarius pseudohatsudake]|nr:hypothetical protein EDB85DRAFT_441726 [Lactarius pseudohatsudake]